MVITNFNGLDNDNRIPVLTVNSPTKELVVANRENDQSFEDLEPYSGASLYARLKMTINFDFKSDDLFSDHNYALIPVVGLDRHGGMSDDAIQKVELLILELWTTQNCQGS